MTLDRAAGAVTHHRFHEMPALLRPGDLLVANDTRVLPARLFAMVSGKGGAESGGSKPREVEVLLLRREPSAAKEQIWSALAKPAKALKPGVRLSFVDPGFQGEVLGWGDRGVRHIAFRPAGATAGASSGEAPPFEAWLSRVGHVPLPPYIERPDEPEGRER